jgi:hypothetical protein
MKRGLALLAVVAALAATTVALAAPSYRSFSDSTGDSAAAPDITRVEVGTDVVRGPIVLWVNTPNRTALAAADSFGIILDTDLNGGTGDPAGGGADYLIVADETQGVLLKWNGTQFAQVPAASLKSEFSTADKALRVEIHPNELGGTRGFNFFLFSTDGADAFDDAPDGTGIWSYSLESGRVVLSKESARATALRAGRPFALVMVPGREDINEILDEGRVACSLKIGKGRAAVTSGRFTDAGATCAWRIPKTAKGKRAVAKITVTFGGSSVSHMHTAVVKK